MSPMSGRYGISERIKDLARGPDRMEFRLVHDKERNLWLGQHDDRLRFESDPVPITAEGATPSEVLRKLAELME